MYDVIPKNDIFDEEIDRLMGCLGDMEPDSKSYALIEKAVEKLEKMRCDEFKVRNEQARLRMEEEKMRMDEKSRTLENEMKELHRLEESEARNEEAIAKKRFEILKLCVEIAGIVLPLAFCWVWMCRGLAFEEAGVFTSKTFQGLAGKFSKFI